MKKELSMMLIIASLLCLSSCSKDEDEMTISTDYVEIYVEDTYSLTCSKKDVTWTTDNKLIASVTDGLIKGIHVGETMIHVEDLTCRVKVKPKYNMFTEPSKNFGASMTTIKNYMSGYTLRSEGSDYITYYGKGKTLVYSYLFKAGKMEMSAFTVDVTDCVDLVHFLEERYLLMDAKKMSNSNYQYGFLSLDTKYAIICDVSTTSGGFVTYSN